MSNTLADDLRRTARLIHLRGLHRGEQFAAYGQLDITAAAYNACEAGPIPAEFFTDEDASVELIQSSARAMATIRAISDALDTEACETNGQPDYIEHVSNWAATASIGQDFPPTTAEVIGRVLRAAQQATPNAA